MIFSKLINVITKNKNKSVNILSQNLLQINFLSYFPKIWYNGNIYIELYTENEIIGYIKIIYIDYDYKLNKNYKKKEIIYL